MKIQCNVCEAAEANVLCCADEAALCLSCDQKVHAANKLASKHQRVSLSTSSSRMPKCDICQEALGYFFCLEDRALLCRKCDVAVHTANALVSGHQRFLLTGVKVGLEANENVPSSSSGKFLSPHNDENSRQEPHSLPRTTNGTRQVNKNLPFQANNSLVEDFSSSMLAFTGGSTTVNTPPWQFEGLLDLGDYIHDFNFMDNGSSKLTLHAVVFALRAIGTKTLLADSGKLGDSDCSSMLRAADGDLEGDEYMGQVPDSFYTVPDLPSPPTASGLHWPKKARNPYDSSVFVPDIGSTPLENSHYCHSNVDSFKRRRHS
ncbi:hypothetical protein OROMI_020032 [Orobanche minor]